MKPLQARLMFVIFFVAILSIGLASPAAAQPGLGIEDFNVPSEAAAGEEVEIQLTSEISEAPADWAGQLEFTTYVDGTPVNTQVITVEDGETIDVDVLHAFQDSGNKEVYMEISGELERQGLVTEQSIDIDRTTSTVTVDVSPATMTVEGAVFTAPESLQSEIDELRDDIPIDTGPNAFVLASEDELYIVFSDEEPQEGYATVEGVSPNVADIEHDGLEFGTIVATDVTFEAPSQLSVTEAYENSEQYDRQYVEIDAFHRAVSIDYEGIDRSATAGVLVEDPFGDDLFDSFGGRTQTLTDGIEGDRVDGSLDENVEAALGDLTQPRVVTSSTEVEYWDDTEAAISGIVAAPDTPARDFIETFQENDPLPTDSSTPVLYVIETEYDSQPVSSISEISEDPSAYDGQTVTFESNLYMTTVSSASVIESATGTPIPIDVILHGGAAWDQLPEDRDEVVSIMGASSINQDNLTDTHRGTYQITGEIVSTDRIEGDLPQGYILVAYDLERTGSLDVASVNDVIEMESSGVSDVLENQANPEVDTAAASPDDGQHEAEDSETEDEEQSPSETEESDEDEILPEDVDDQVGFTVISGMTALLLTYFIIRVVG